MTYALLLLALVAALTWSAWGGISVPELERGSIREKVIQVYEQTKERVTDAIKNKAKEELHNKVDKAFEE